MITVWLRVIRVRFLLASVIAVSVGLAINWNLNNSIDPFAAFLTLVGVMALHASVDLLNDFWDFKRGIDTITKRTKMSGGTGVLPEGLLKPSSVYRAGIVFLIIGGTVGTYFVFTNGLIIAVILAFAILSIYFYSTKIIRFWSCRIFCCSKGNHDCSWNIFYSIKSIIRRSCFGRNNSGGSLIHGSLYCIISGL